MNFSLFFSALCCLVHTISRMNSFWRREKALRANKLADCQASSSSVRYLSSAQVHTVYWKDIYTVNFCLVTLCKPFLFSGAIYVPKRGQSINKSGWWNTANRLQKGPLFGDGLRLRRPKDVRQSRTRHEKFTQIHFPFLRGEFNN